MAEPETLAEAAETTVRALLAAARLSPGEEEIAGLVGMYPDYKAGIEALYAVPETRYASPALVFDSAPNFADWAS